MQTTLYELAYLAQSERKDRQRQDNEPRQGIKRYVVENAVYTRDIDNGDKHYERESDSDVHHLVRKQSELEYRDVF